MARRISGTREWATSAVNCCLGCSHDCKYCYARINALKYGKISSLDQWPNEQVIQSKVDIKYGKRNGTIMFPTQHDITPGNLDSCVIVIRKLLRAGNNVLIVSKPHLDCIKRLCEVFTGFQDLILFRFTIGAMDDKILKFWEPGAPSFEERFKALSLAHDAGFRTSVSAEPMLDSENIVSMVHTLTINITDSIWIGKMNKPEQRVDDKTKNSKQFKAIVDGQTDDRIREIYNSLKNIPIVKWKESFKEVLGLELAAEPGMDI